MNLMSKQKIIAMKKSIWILAALLMFSVGFRAPESRTITGKVTASSDGSVMPGVNVLAKGSSIGTVTDASGNYSITIPSQSGVLVFSFIGYVSTEVKIGTTNVVNVAMSEDVQQLSEVVVIGYGIQTRKDVTGSVSAPKSRGKRSAGAPAESKAAYDMAYAQPIV